VAPIPVYFLPPFFAGGLFVMTVGVLPVGGLCPSGHPPTNQCWHLLQYVAGVFISCLLSPSNHSRGEALSDSKRSRRAEVSLPSYAVLSSAISVSQRSQAAEAPLRPTIRKVMGLLPATMANPATWMTFSGTWPAV